MVRASSLGLCCKSFPLPSGGGEKVREKKKKNRQPPTRGAFGIQPWSFAQWVSGYQGTIESSGFRDNGLG